MRRSYSGGAQPARLTSPLGGSISDLSIICDDLTNWPDGSGGAPFYVVVDRGTSAEEKILCSSRSGNTLTVWSSAGSTGRAADGTPNTSHSVNAIIEHCFTAVDADEANAHVNADAQVHGLDGYVVGTTDTQTLTNKTLTDPIIAGGAADFDDLQIAGVNPVTVSATQTLTNKTLTTPNITAPVITGGSATNFPPIGTITAYAGQTAPTGWLLCNGQAVSTTTYADLYSVCGTYYNATGGQSAPTAGTFRVPLLTGRIPVGVGDADLVNTVGGYGGSKTSTAPHVHPIPHGHAATGSSAAADISHVHNANHGHTASGSSNTTGSGHSHGAHVSEAATGSSGSFRLQYNGSNNKTDIINFNDGGHTHGISVSVEANNFNTAGMSDHSTDHSHGVSVSVTSTPGTENSGASSAAVASIGNAQPYTVVNYIIKAL